VWYNIYDVVALGPRAAVDCRESQNVRAMAQHAQINGNGEVVGDCSRSAHKTQTARRIKHSETGGGVGGGTQPMAITS
jgi:hypothetical protein